MTKKNITGSFVLIMILFSALIAVFCSGLIVANAEAGADASVNATVIANGNCGAYGDNLAWSLTDDGLLTVEGSGAMKNYRASNMPWYSHRDKITSVLIGDGVTDIGEYAFYECTNMTSVSMVDSVEGIGEWAFYECTALNAVSLSNNLDTIGDYAFCDCESLENVSMNERVSSIGVMAFAYCRNLSRIEIPDSVTKLGESAFSYCYGLTEVIIGSGVSVIEDMAFDYCSNLTDLVIGECVESIGNDAFYNCDSLPDVTIPDSVKSIGERAFADCYRLNSAVIGNGVESIGEEAFYGCDQLVEVINRSALDITVGDFAYGYAGYYAIEVHTGESKVVDKDGWIFYACDSVNYLISYDGTASKLVLPNGFEGEDYIIHDFAFDRCTALTEVEIPNNVVAIGEKAFYGCTGLTRIELPSSVKRIGASAFEKCSSVTNIVIGSGVESIGDRAFASCGKINSISIPKNVDIIGDGAFYNCLSLTDISVETGSESFRSVDGDLYTKDGKSLVQYAVGKTLTEFVVPDCVEIICNYAFYDCDELVAVVIGDNVKSIGAYAFYDCDHLNSVSIGTGITNIGDYAFSYCSQITDIGLGDCIERIGDHAFYYCTGLSELVIGKNLTAVDNYAFYCCRGLTRIVLPEELTDIGNMAFAGCSSLESVNLPESLKRIGGSAFLNCYALTEAIIPDGITVIENYTFENCSSLSGLTIGDSVEKIGEGAFADCSGLTEVVIPDSVRYIGEYAFWSCSGMTCAVIGRGVESIGCMAFDSCSVLSEVTFKNTVGWLVGESAIASSNLKNANTAATLLKNTAEDISWRCEHIHSYDKTVVFPTCIKSGYTLYSCEACGDIFKDDYIAPTGIHTYDAVADESCNICGELREIEGYIDYGTCGVTAFWTLDDDGMLTLCGEGSTYCYTGKGMPWYSYKSQITKVVVEEGIVSIGASSFYEFTSITEIVLPEGLRAIGQYAFYGCSSVTELIIPQSVYYIGNYALRKLGATGKVDIVFADPSGWYRNGEAITSEFMSDVALITNDIRKVNYTANWNKVSEDPNIVAEGTCGKTATWVIDSNGTLTVCGEGHITEFLTKGAPWFKFNASIVKVVIGEGITRVGKCSFYGADNILSVQLPESLKTISSYAFYHCRNLKEITVPENVTTIRQYAFRQCRSLTSVNLGIKYGWSAGETPFISTELSAEGAVYLFTKAYYSVDWTRDVNAEDDTDPNRLAAGICGDNLKWQINIDGTLHIKGNGAMTNYNSAGDTLPWKSYADQITKVVIEEGVTSIGDYAFYNVFTKIESVSLPQSLTTIGKYAFYGASGVKELTVPANVTSIEGMAFRKLGATGKLSVYFAVTEGWTCGGSAVDFTAFADAIATGNAIRGSDYSGAWVR